MALPLLLLPCVLRSVFDLQQPCCRSKTVGAAVCPAAGLDSVPDVRFGVSMWSATEGTAWRESAHRFEDLGFSTLWVPDHVGMFDPFVGLAAAAGATSHVRLGTYVLNIEFWNPLLLARAAATAHIVSDGRLIVGLGAGHAKVEFEQAGLRYPPPSERIDRLTALVPALRQLLAGETVDDPALGLTGAATGLAPTTPELLIGGNGDRVLHLAGGAADVVGLTGFTSGTGQVHTDLSHWTWDGLADRVAHVRAAAAGRRLRTDVLVQRVAVVDDPLSALSDFVDAGMSPDMFDSPFLLVGPEPLIVERLHRLADLGIDGVTTFSPHADALATAIPHFA
jgi:probable F420-dependent oxidoreductase